MKPLQSLQMTSIKKPLIPLARQQVGVALLVVLLLVVMIVILAGSMMASKEMTIRKSRLLFQQDRLLQQIQVGEQIAIELIRTDSQLNDFDSLQDVWATEIQPYHTNDGYQIELVINDASARFNLNNLYHDGAVDKHALEGFQRLLEALELDSELATAVLDWQDPDSLVYDDGGEEDVVYRAETQERTSIANQPFISIEQLADLPNVTAETMAILRPYVTAVPYWLPINVNTADEMVLTALVGSENSTAVQRLLKERTNRPIDSDEALQGLKLVGNVADKMTMDNVEGGTPTNNKKSTGDTNESNSDDSNSDESLEATTKKDINEKKIAKQKKENNEKAIASLYQSLSYQSRAFEVLVAASIEQFSMIDSTKTNKKTRFATLYIAKGDALSVDKEQEHLIQSNINNEPSIRSFSQRMWAFRPAFSKNN